MSFIEELRTAKRLASQARKKQVADEDFVGEFLEIRDLLRAHRDSPVLFAEISDCLRALEDGDFLYLDRYIGKLIETYRD